MLPRSERAKHFFILIFIHQIFDNKTEYFSMLRIFEHHECANFYFQFKRYYEHETISTEQIKRIPTQLLGTPMFRC